MANVDVRFVAYCPCGVSTGTRLGTCADSGREREYRKRENQRPRAGVKNIVNRAVGVERSGQHAYRLACMGLPPPLIRCVVGERQFEFDASGRHVEYADAAAMRTVRPHMVGPRDACPAVRRESVTDSPSIAVTGYVVLMTSHARGFAPGRMMRRHVNGDDMIVIPRDRRRAGADVPWLWMVGQCGAYESCHGVRLCASCRLLSMPVSTGSHSRISTSDHL